MRFSGLRYTDLFAEDADGRLLPTSMRLVGQHIELHVDDSQARYPIVVDPLVWPNAGKRYLPKSLGYHDKHGSCIAMSGGSAC